jgi:uncharacterized protein (TIGR02466 family)
MRDFQLNPAIRKEYYDIFPTRVFTVDIADSKFLNNRLIKLLKDDALTGESRSISNIGGHQTKDGMFLDDTNSKAKHHLLQEMIRGINDISKSMHIDIENYDIECQQSWGNVNAPGAVNMIHMHPMTHWACVYYVCIPENSGKFIINDPRGALPHMYSTPYINGESPFKGDPLEPEISSGRLLIFPGWLSHEVSPNLSNENRYSIAANFSYVLKKT